jgi:uncharacterized tellurite resistance protein B-like protein
MGTDEEEYQGQLLALMRKLIAADGVWAEEEKAWLKLLEKEYGPEDGSEAEFDPLMLQKVVKTEGEAEELIELLLMVSLSDGETCASEWRLIQEVARLVGVSEEDTERLRSETVLAVDP